MGHQFVIAVKNEVQSCKVGDGFYNDPIQKCSELQVYVFFLLECIFFLQYFLFNGITFFFEYFWHADCFWFNTFQSKDCTAPPLLPFLYKCFLQTPCHMDPLWELKALGGAMYYVSNQVLLLLTWQCANIQHIIPSISPLVQLIADLGPEHVVHQQPQVMQCASAVCATDRNSSSACAPLQSSQVGTADTCNFKREMNTHFCVGANKA